MKKAYIKPLQLHVHRIKIEGLMTGFSETVGTGTKKDGYEPPEIYEQDPYNPDPDPDG